MARARSRSIVGSWYDPAPQKKVVMKQKTIVEDDKAHIDPNVKQFMYIRTVLMTIVGSGMWALAEYVGFNGSWSFAAVFAFANFSMVEIDAKQFGNKFTITRHEGIKLDTPTKISDASGRRLTIAEVLPKDFKL